MARARRSGLAVPELIVRKRGGDKLGDQDIRQLIDGFMDGSVTDYQMSAFAMAVYFQGMDFDETVAMTLAMRDSGKVLDFDAIDGPKVDKHSTGGVGDKVSICLAPIVAACGLVVPMMSGRGLGHTGGTLDKLEAIPGFRVDLTIPEFRSQLRRIGCALIGQTGDLAPADKRLYALRDVTGTVESIPLITEHPLEKARRGDRRAGARREGRPRCVHEEPIRCEGARALSGASRKTRGKEGVRSADGDEQPDRPHDWERPRDRRSDRSASRSRSG